MIKFVLLGMTACGVLLSGCESSQLSETASPASVDKSSSGVEELAKVSASDDDFNANASAFLKAVTTENAQTLSLYSEGITENGNLIPRIKEYINGPIRKVHQGERLKFKMWGDYGNDFSVIFYQESAELFISKVDIDYLKKNYLKTYFVCDFTKVNGGWKLRNGFCYDETDGPYAEEDPNL